MSFRGEAEAQRRSRARNPYVDGPHLQELCSVQTRIACDHMYGLLSRSHRTAAKMGSAAEVPNISAVLDTDGFHGVSPAFGSIDPHHLPVLQLRPLARAVARAKLVILAPVKQTARQLEALARSAQRSPGSAARAPRGMWSVPDWHDRSARHSASASR